MDMFEATCKILSTGSGALEALGKVIGGSTNYCLKFRQRDCYYCGQKVRGADLRSHVEKHRDHMECCYICGDRFKADELKAHVESHSLVECRYCKMVVKICSYIDHVETHRSMKCFEECFICGKEFKSEDLRTHVIEVHSVVKCRVCKALVKVEDYADHLDVHRTVKCRECKCNIQVDEFYDHMDTHRHELVGKKEIARMLQYMEDYVPVTNITNQIVIPTSSVQSDVRTYGIGSSSSKRKPKCD